MNQQRYLHKETPAHQYQTPISATNPSQDAYPTFRAHHAPSNLLTPISAAPQTPDNNMNGQPSSYSTGPAPNALQQSNSCPRASRANVPPAQQSHASARSLPSRTLLTDEAFEDAYVQFILYCNPTIPQDVNTQDLRKVFASPPRSDSKTFSTKKLFGLLRQMDQKELKTWTQLALKLGVEKPSIEKGQSSQKLQQYSVRLKRWLRASHVDAFFDYMMGKSHKYMELPSLDDPFPEERDGVFAEDDLALRALKPEFRPKRGRKRAESDEITSMSAIEPKRPHLDTSFDSIYPQSAYPGSMSAHPDNMDKFSHGQWETPTTAIPQSAIPKSGPTTTQWRLNAPFSIQNQSSATTSSAEQALDSLYDDSSASQSQKLRMRRRHGTAVSSAWPSNGTTPNGKLRGRPPANRSLKDGPFISFPANPNAKEGPAIGIAQNVIATPIEEHRLTSGQSTAQTPNSPFRVPTYPTPISATNKSNGRPERLSLQVPQHVGNPVRLVTPTVTLNVENGQHISQPDGAGVASNPSRFLPVISNDDLKRSLAADLLKADVTGRPKALRGTEAKDLAESLFTSIRLRITSHAGESNAESREETFSSAFATWFGLNPPLHASQSWTPASSSGVKKIHIRRFRIGTDGYDMPIEDDDGQDLSDVEVKQTYDIDWELNLGGLSGRFQIKGVMIDTTAQDSPDDDILEDEEEAEEESVVPASADSWKRKVLDLQAKLKERDERIQAMQDRVLEAVLL